MHRITLEVYFADDPGPLTPEAVAKAACANGPAIAFCNEDDTAVVDSHQGERAALAAEYFEHYKSLGSDT